MNNEIAKLIAMFANNAGVTFVNIKGYTSKKSEQTEVSDYFINVGANFKNAKDADIEYLKALDVTGLIDDKFNKTTLEQAKAQLLGELVAPSKTRSEAQVNAYTHICNGVKYAHATNELIIYGLIVRKTVIVEGEYKATNVGARNPLVPAKNYLKKELKHTKFRQFCVSLTGKCKMKGEELVINDTEE